MTDTSMGNALIHQFGLLNPSSLIIIAIVIVAILFEWRASRARAAARQALQLPAAAAASLRRTLGFCTVVLLVAAVSRPFWGWEDIETTSNGDDVIFLVDISRSMYAHDLPPSRIELAKRKVKDLVQSLSANGSAAGFGITVFAGDGYTVCPVTTDRGVLAQFIEILSPELVTSLGSNLRAGVIAALGRLDEVALRHSRMIILSDGEDNFLDQTALIQEIKDRGVRVDVLGIGTATGAAIALPNGAPLVDGARRPVVSTLKEEPLKAIATAGGGIYVRTSLDDTDIQTLATPAILPSSSASNNKSLIRTYRELGPWLALIALVILVISSCNRRTNPLLVVPLLALWAGIGSVHAQTPPPSNTALSLLSSSPFEAYKRGDYQKAFDEYSEALTRAPNDRTLLFGLASSLHRLGRYEESARAFRKLADSSRSGREYFENTYNEGNALLAQGRYSEAIDAYWGALDVKPDDEAALHNVAVARSLLEQQRNATPTPTPTPTPTAPPQSSPQPSPNAENSPDPKDQSKRDEEPTPQPSPTTTGEQPAVATPSPSGGSANPTATAASTGAAATAVSTPSPAQTGAAHPSNQPTPEDRLKESLDSDAPQPPPPSSPVPHTEQPEAFPEAQAWLDSLPDSPLLVRKYRGTPSVGGQTW